MDNIKDNNYFIARILEDIRFIISHTAALSVEEFTADEVLQDSMMFRLVQISENSGRLTPEFREKHSSVPWGDIAGLRNRIVHDYGNVNLQIVFDTLKDDIPDLKDIFETL